MSVPPDWNAWPQLTEQVPAPPPGPGVRAPFAAPPTERDRKRMWIGLGLGALLLVLCCGGGIAGFAGLVVAEDRAVPREAVTVVDRYLRGLHDGDYREAYDQLCTARRGNETLAQFTARERDLPGINDYRIGKPQVAGSQVWVPARVYRSSGLEDRTYLLVADSSVGALRICEGG
ncbi:MAG: hypothetical protein AUG44_25070 [Actinobacteria bacterium 13_1_20CM_3_71_11]|nr:MAG: hypothetical protein AUG44_25070 [Actinobacteria bacterium 13_1_20CM_3_71_11]